MDYRSLRIKDGNIDKVPSSAVITKTQLKDAIQTVNANQGGLKVEGKISTGNGISFVGPYGVVLADFTYSVEEGRHVINLNPNAMSQYKAQVKKEKHKRAVRRFVVCRVLPFGLAVVVVGTGIVHVIKGFFKGVELPTSNGTEIVNVAGASLEDEDFATVMRWADYAMTQYEDDITGSQYEEHVRPRYEYLYSDSYIPLYSTYEDYTEALESVEMFPNHEGVKNSVTSKKTEFYNYAEQLNNSLDKKYRFENSIFSRAIIIDSEKDEKHASEVDVYVPLAEVDKEGIYSFDNMPDGSIIHEGKIYVPYSMLYEEHVKSNSKN